MAEDRGTDSVTLDEFGLLYSLGSEPQNVPKGRSYACPNVQSYPGRVGSRFGFSNVASFSALQVVSIKEFVLPDVSAKRLLLLTSDGTLQKETGTYSFSNVCAGFTEGSISARMMSVTQFGREYFALNDSGKVPYAMAKSYDDTNVDEVAPGRPEVAPTLANGTGAVSAGVHTVRVAYLTRTGYITPPGPAATITMDGAHGITVSNIPTGPSWVTGRILCFSPAGVPDLYYIAGTTMHVGDNTTTTVSNIDFTDSNLISGTPISIADDPLSDRLNLVELPSQTGVMAYHNRLFWWGERNAFYKVGDSGPQNLNFNGGWTGSVPNGWTQKIAGQSRGTVDTGAYGEYLIFTGDGTNAKGELANNAKILSWPRVRPGVEVRCRVRVKKNAAAAAGTLHVFIVDTSAGNNISGGASFNVSAMSNSEWRVLDAQVMAPASFTPASTWEVRITTGGTGVGGGTALSNTGTILLDFLELYHGDKPYSYSQVRASRVGQPDAYDDVFGVMTVGFDDGQAIRSGFVIGDNMYLVKERSLYQVRDDGVSEPAFWGVSPVSDADGTPSQRGIGRGDQWVVIASRAGLYYFSGGTPILMTADIQDTWNQINWQYGHLLWVEVDIEKKRIYVGVPFGSSTFVNQILTFQWWGQNPAGATAASGATAVAQMSPWSLADNATFAIHCATFSERSNGQRDFLIGTSHFTNNLGKYDTSARSDTMGNTTQAIAASYRTSPLGQAGKRLLFSRYTMNVKGSGTLNTAIYLPDNATTITPAIPAYTLQAAPKGDTEFPRIRAVTERCFFDWSVNATGHWFSISRFALFGKEKPAGAERRTRDY